MDYKLERDCPLLLYSALLRASAANNLGQIAAADKIGSAARIGLRVKRLQYSEKIIKQVTLSEI